MTVKNETQLAAGFEQLFAPTELHPELAEYLTYGQPFDMLRHPLVYGVPYSEQMNNYYNKQLEMKKTATAEALRDGDLSRYVFMHERPYRLDAFTEFVASRIVTDKNYWEMLSSVWVDSENIWQHMEQWRMLLGSFRPGKRFFMSKDERQALQQMPSRFPVYRGCVRGQNEDGLSWTLDRTRAVWFSKRLNHDGDAPCVREKIVRKKDVFAYLNGRNEDEIIVL